MANLAASATVLRQMLSARSSERTKKGTSSTVDSGTTAPQFSGQRRPRRRRGRSAPTATIFNQTLGGD